jgi:hypothetical protein
MSWGWIERMPSTNARIGVTILMAMGTGARVLISGWSPPDNWLWFLTAWAGIDVLQFVGKRATFKPDGEA